MSNILAVGKWARASKGQTKKIGWTIVNLDVVGNYLMGDASLIIIIISIIIVIII